MTTPTNTSASTTGGAPLSRSSPWACASTIPAMVTRSATVKKGSAGPGEPKPVPEPSPRASESATREVLSRGTRTHDRSAARSAATDPRIRASYYVLGRRHHPFRRFRPYRRSCSPRSRPTAGTRHSKQVLAQPIVDAHGRQPRLSRRRAHEGGCSAGHSPGRSRARCA